MYLWMYRGIHWSTVYNSEKLETTQPLPKAMLKVIMFPPYCEILCNHFKDEVGSYLDMHESWLKTKKNE